MAKKMSTAQLKALEQTGAATQRKKKLRQPDPVARQSREIGDGMTKAADAMQKNSETVKVGLEQTGTAIHTLAQELGRGQMMMAEKLETVLRNNMEPGKAPLPYRFTVHRSRNNLIDYIDAVPIEADS